ncbi:MAG: PEP-CTERM sorting domain-containing protein [Bryobacteraceae bacterium]|nr:PEP-CTERM sorting domain-containing protein [Solibacteraceae bacterium]MCO5349307.1 PEP-CTERM sorting domain-containing protein [Bryobacteraceae bacterium]HAX41139.1 hypothetical protein [Bryobacterales bacterium]HRJ21000.1 PEP-CTERM sorting domain-containing protein [Bryobacteraceae bacterium]
MLRKILPVLALVAALFVAAPTQAAIVQLGPVSPNGGTPLSAGDTLDLVWNLPNDILFINSITFELNGRSGLGDSTADFRFIVVNPGTNYRIFNNAANWFSTGADTPFDLNSGALTDGATSSNGGVLDFGQLISAGLITSRIVIRSGDFLDVGFTSANVTLDYRAVPEPGTVALMGFGLLAVGFAARRRRKA